MKPTLSSVELYLLAYYAIAAESNRREAAVKNPVAGMTLRDLGLIEELNGAPRLSEKGEVLLDYFQRSPLPAAQTAWSMPPRDY